VVIDGLSFDPVDLLADIPLDNDEGDEDD